MKKYSSVLFDLDGTLLNTLGDIADAINNALKSFKYDAKYSEADVATFIGSGMKVLVEKATKPFNIADEEKMQIQKLYQKLYHENCLNKTYPYNGVKELLQYLKTNHYQIGVISNKPQEEVSKCIDYYFHDTFDFAFGAKNGVKTKPSKEAFDLLAKEYHLDNKTTLYVGDMNQDIEFAINVNMDLIIYKNGYGKNQKLLEHDYEVDSLMDIIKILEENGHEKDI